MPQNKIVRSIFVLNNRIYVGSFEEFGFFEKNLLGQLVYTSLSDQFKGYDMKNDEIWTILQGDGGVIFQSFTSYFIYKDTKITGIRVPYTFLFFNEYKANVFTYTEQIGFSKLNFETNIPEKIESSILTSAVFSVLKFDPLRALIVTKSDGLFLYDESTIVPFKTEADNEITIVCYIYS